MRALRRSYGILVLLIVVPVAIFILLVFRAADIALGGE